MSAGAPARHRTAARRTCSRAAAGCRCASTATSEAVDFAIVGTGAGGGDAGLQAGRGRLFGGRASTPARSGGRSRISPPTRSSSRSSTGPTSAITGGDDPIELGGNNSRPRRRRQHGPLHDDLAALPAGVVQVRARSSATASTGRSPTRRWRLTTARPRGAEDLRPGPLSVGPAARALSLSRRTR